MVEQVLMWLLMHYSTWTVMGLVFLLLMAVVPLVVVLLFINKWLANHWSWETLRYISDGSLSYEPSWKDRGL